VSSLFLGLDTSCYSTSLAALDEEGRLIHDWRRMLKVKDGQIGLRQSEAFFQHIKNIPHFFEETAEPLLQKTRGIAVSTRPRPREGSYMPVFLAGESVARSLAAGMAASLTLTTHQEGHIMAGLWSAGLAWQDFWVFHVSGGTTEVLEVKRRKNAWGIKLKGGGEDLSAGQFIDRIGVRLGLPFPAGKHLESLALEAEDSLDLPVALKGNKVSFSGPESQAQRLLDQGARPAVMARSVEECVARSLAGLARQALKGQEGQILFVGGVMANERIKGYLQQHVQGELAFATPKMSGDNAVGVAEIARQSWLATKKGS
jgi:N6-L-threonylcarbamoyladenine synthase